MELQRIRTPIMGEKWGKNGGGTRHYVASAGGLACPSLLALVLFTMQIAL